MNPLAILATGGAAPPTYVEDVFSAYTYTGNGGTQTITNGIDLSGKGGMVWLKRRSAGVDSHYLGDTTRGFGNFLCSDTTGQNQALSGAWSTAVSSTGFSFSTANTALNASSNDYASWTFAQAAKFFKVVQVTVSGSNQVVDLSSLGTVGMAVVKRTDSASAWYVLHKNNTAGKLCYLNTTAAETTNGSLTLSGTNLTLVQATIGNGTYIVYAWAHDTASTGIVQCGTFTTDGSGVFSATTTFEPQLVLMKSIATAGTDWQLYDSSRGFTVTNTTSMLAPNVSDAQNVNTWISPTSTGFGSSTGTNITPSTTFIYLAIRRGPMKLPTVGTQVYNAIARTGTGWNPFSITGIGFVPDSLWTQARNDNRGPTVLDRLLGDNTHNLIMSSTNAEYDDTSGSGATYATVLTMDGIKNTTAIAGANANVNASGDTFINWFFRRAPGVFDEVCYMGTGSALTVAHNLGVVPELIICKVRGVAGYAWEVYTAALGATKTLFLNQTDGSSGASVAYWNNTTPTATNFYVNYHDNNVNTYSHVAYLFATLAGVSKVGSYTGNGSNQTINCGFSAGARFIMIKRTDSTGDWFVWDSTRGIVAGNDPHLSLNTTAAEVTTDDSIDPDNSGFIVNELAATHINVTSATYIYLSFA